MIIARSRMSTGLSVFMLSSSRFTSSGLAQEAGSSIGRSEDHVCQPGSMDCSDRGARRNLRKPRKSVSFRRTRLRDHLRCFVAAMNASISFRQSTVRDGLRGSYQGQEAANRVTAVPDGSGGQPSLTLHPVGVIGNQIFLLQDVWPLVHAIGFMKAKPSYSRPHESSPRPRTAPALGKRRVQPTPHPRASRLLKLADRHAVVRGEIDHASDTQDHMGGSFENVATDTFRSLKHQTARALAQEGQICGESDRLSSGTGLQTWRILLSERGSAIRTEYYVLSSETIALRPRQFRRLHHINGYATFPIKCATAHLIGTLNAHRFDALVFAEHAECPDYELGDSRISKLWLKRLDGGKDGGQLRPRLGHPPATKDRPGDRRFPGSRLAELVYDK